jgi:hypothetical protein
MNHPYNHSLQEALYTFFFQALLEQSACSEALLCCLRHRILLNLDRNKVLQRILQIDATHARVN